MPITFSNVRFRDKADVCPELLTRDEARRIFGEYRQAPGAADRHLKIHAEYWQ
jgi:hypothetical protein